MTNLRIGYFGDGPWALLALERLIALEDVEVQFVCARWPDPDSGLTRRAEDAGIRIVEFPRVNADDALSELRLMRCDLMVSMSYDQIFSEGFLGIAPLGTVNCHAGLLPFYRGRNVLNWALINDEAEFGVTAHFVDAGTDTGDIIVQTRHAITDDDDYASLLARAAIGCADAVTRAVSEIAAGRVKRVPQSSIHPVGSYCPRRVQGDEVIDWRSSAREVFNFVRALVPPGPAARSSLADHEYRILKVRTEPLAVPQRGIPGAVLARTAAGFLVQTGDTFVEVLDWEGGATPRVGSRFGTVR